MVSVREDWKAREGDNDGANGWDLETKWYCLMLWEVCVFYSFLC